MFKEDEVFSKRQNGSVSVMIWAFCSLRGKATLVFLDENQDSADFTTIIIIHGTICLSSIMLEMHMVPWADTVHPNN